MGGQLRLLSRHAGPRSAALLLMATLLAACGGGGGSGGNGASATAPSISNLSFSPSAVYVGAGGGQQTISGSVDFSDADGNVATSTLEVLDNTGKIIDTQSVPVSGASGIKSGTINGEVVVDTSASGAYTIRVTVNDSTGLPSNTLTSSFRISEFPWVPRSAMLLPRSEFATAMVNGRIYVLGGGDTQAGITPAPATTTVQVYDPASDTWTTETAMPQSVRNHAAVAIGTLIYVVGGESDGVPGLRALQVYDTGTRTWALKADMPTELAGLAATTVGGRLLVFGGESGGLGTSTSISYDPASNAWTAHRLMMQAGSDMAATAVGGKAFAFGGYGMTWIADGGYFRMVQQYDPTADSWLQGTDMPTACADPALAVVNGTIFVMGGNNVARALDDVASYDPVAGMWRAKTPMPQLLGRPRAEVVNAKVYVFDTGVTFEYTPENDIL